MDVSNFERPCSHDTAKFKCNKFSLRLILKNREKFFKNQNKVDQDVYLTRLIAPYTPERRRQSTVDENRRRNRLISTTYFLNDKNNKNRPVCKAMFMKTFSLKKDRVINIAKTVFEGGTPKEKRGGDRKSAKSAVKKEKLREFLRKLPATESHYTRSKSKRIYLSCDLNQRKLRQLYNDPVPQELHVTKTMFQNIFAEDFNIGFKSPASDMCSTCVLLSNKIKMAPNHSDDKRTLMVQKRVHNLRAKAFYKLCKNDDPDSENFCFDLQQVQPLPRTPIQESFYSRQISYYNLCFVGMDSRNPRFYQWSEDQGGRGATEVGSALLHHLNSLNLVNKTVVRLFCDGCGGQNKNSHIVHCLMFWLVNESPEDIKEIHLTFPVRGHSFLPADRVFGRVEKSIRTVPIITQKEEYQRIYKTHGDVLLLDQDWSLKDVKGLETFYRKLEGMRDLKRIHLKKYAIRAQGTRKQSKTLYEVKTFRNFINESEQERKRFSILKSKKTHPRSMRSLNEKRSISTQKKADVKFLMVKQFGDDWEKDEGLSWYKNLLSENSTEPVESVVAHGNDNDSDCDCMEPEIAPIV